jgi:CRISPR-associated protein Csm1
VGWDDYKRLIEQGNWMHQLVQKGSIPLGLLNRLLYYGGERRAFLRGEIKRGIYLSHMAYDFTRNLNESKLADPAERNQLLAVQRDEFLLEHIRLPASYALYRLRKDV